IVCVSSNPGGKCIKTRFKSIPGQRDFPKYTDDYEASVRQILTILDVYTFADDIVAARLFPRISDFNKIILWCPHEERSWKLFLPKDNDDRIFAICLANEPKITGGGGQILFFSLL
ncbi:MAG: hypothetical protein EB038_06960, partial [Cyclobacteriaceae bacterium]|nr:hypothetical protein [Cyclobacteriaceae bacterium]